MNLHLGNQGLRTKDQFDWPLFICAALIAVVGIVNLYSATSVYGASRSELYLNQVYWLVAGGILAVIVASLDYRFLEQAGYVIYAVGVLLLIIVLILGKDIRGSARWIPIGSFSFQPSEFMKLALTIALAKYLHTDPKSEARTLRDLIVPTLLTLLPVVLVQQQPDLGTSIILALIFGSILVLTRIHWKTSLFSIVSVSSVAILMWNYGLKDYQRGRITAFLNPEADIRGVGWHAHHARIAIGNGGFFGQGYMKGTQNQYLFLPDQYTDFPFPVFAEDWGFLGCMVLIGLYAFLILWSVRIAAQARDRFGAVLAVGVGAMLFWHTIFNLGMVLGLLPVVGVTLPLFSYGGSSVITILIGLGLLMNVSLRRFSGTTLQGPRRLL
ncbi:MAG TPA: rod shape-determining protein RodA [Polyangiaceae bacterium]|jgi:rod shape determining protein RodA|nr:MAG: Rod shape-determining protein RodA [Deltaproteobacteria bacterium ADurb.Bin207]HNS96878.1 rod shape-determining protein RodA [Polyangiaceae bacterium]HNZ24421.1 rod shape-determining protein RodA [Polyangiaceae bacterium]HOD22485.1 rod shape-determining protein RodA [Polyangiaceae bacterium]HOE49207.1 rod shape-determining protein RodA [Polyangiaceae bacterium]